MAGMSPLRLRSAAYAWARPDSGSGLGKAVTDKSEHAEAKMRLAHTHSSGAVSLEDMAQSGSGPSSRDQCTLRHSSSS